MHDNVGSGSVLLADNGTSLLLQCNCNEPMTSNLDQQDQYSSADIQPKQDNRDRVAFLASRLAIPRCMPRYHQPMPAYCWLPELMCHVAVGWQGHYHLHRSHSGIARRQELCTAVCAQVCAAELGPVHCQGICTSGEVPCWQPVVIMQVRALFVAGAGAGRKHPAGKPPTVNRHCAWCLNGITAAVATSIPGSGGKFAKSICGRFMQSRHCGCFLKQHYQTDAVSSMQGTTPVEGASALPLVLSQLPRVCHRLSQAVCVHCAGHTRRTRHH